MSVQVLPEMPTLGQALSKSLTQGLNQTLPKSIERGALSEGLRQIASKSGSMTPIEQFSAFARLPGGVELAPSIMPFLESERGKAAARREFGDKELPTDTSLSDFGSFTSIDENRPSFGQIRDPGYIAKIAADRSEKTGRPFNEELKHVQEKFNALQARESQFITSKENLTNLLETKLTNISQNTGYGSLPGGYKERLLSEGYEKLKTQPANAVKIAEELAQKAEKFMENRFRLKNFSPSFLGKGDSLRRLEEIRNVYEKSGQLKELEADLTNFLGFSAPYAFKMAYGNSAAVKSDLSSLKKAFIPSKKRSEDVFSKLAKSITPRDSLLSIGISLRKKGYNPIDFLKYVSKNFGERLSEMQKREVESPTRGFSPNLSDIYYETN